MATTLSQIEILRRITERGIKLALSDTRVHSGEDYVDLFQHLLDEIERLKAMLT